MSMKYASIRSMSLELQKLGEDDALEKKPEHPLMTAAKGLGAYGLGTGVGYGGLMLAEKLKPQLRDKRLMSGPAKHIIPAATGLGALAFQFGQDSVFKRMRRNQEEREKMKHDG